MLVFWTALFFESWFKEICDGFENSIMKEKLVAEIEEIKSRHEAKNYTSEERINFAEEIM